MRPKSISRTDCVWINKMAANFFVLFFFLKSVNIGKDSGCRSTEIEGKHNHWNDEGGTKDTERQSRKLRRYNLSHLVFAFKEIHTRQSSSSVHTWSHSMLIYIQRALRWIMKCPRGDECLMFTSFTLHPINPPLFLLDLSFVVACTFLLTMSQQSLSSSE